MIENDTVLYNQIRAEITTPALNKQIELLDGDFHANRDKSCEPVIKRLKEYFESIVKKDTAYIHLSWLRTPYLFENDMRYCLEAFSDEWYHDKQKESYLFSYDYLLPYMNKFREEISQKIQGSYPFIGKKITRQQVVDHYAVFQQYLVELVRKALPRLEIEQNLSFYMGEYHGKSELIFTNLTADKVLLSRIIKNPERYMGKKLTQIKEKEKDLTGLSLPGMRFYKCEFTTCDFSSSILIGSTFEHCCLAGSHFELSYLQDASFKDSDCKGCVFRLAEGNIAAITEGIPSYHGISFAHADLRACDFRCAHVKGADFTGADLTGARFLLSQKESLDISNKQAESINWS